MGLPPKPTYIENPECIPTGSIPDNYVSYTLKHQEALPPITWKNWYKELHWLHVFILFVPPTIGVIGARNTPLQWNTAVWFIVYSFLSGIGKFAFPLVIHGETHLLEPVLFRVVRRIPSLMDTSGVSSNKDARNCSRDPGCRRRRRVDCVVGPWASRSPSIH